MKDTHRLLQLNRRTEFLLDQAELIVSPYKLDRISFYDENLWERYRSKSRRLKNVQRLFRTCVREGQKIVDRMIEAEENRNDNILGKV